MGTPHEGLSYDSVSTRSQLYYLASSTVVSGSVLELRT
jgi:hypothetical protein